MDQEAVFAEQMIVSALHTLLFLRAPVTVGNVWTILDLQGLGDEIAPKVI